MISVYHNEKKRRKLFTTMKLLEKNYTKNEKQTVFNLYFPLFSTGNYNFENVLPFSNIHAVSLSVYLSFQVRQQKLINVLLHNE